MMDYRRVTADGLVWYRNQAYRIEDQALRGRRLGVTQGPRFWLNGYQVKTRDALPAVSVRPKSARGIWAGRPHPRSCPHKAQAGNNLKHLGTGKSKEAPSTCPRCRFHALPETALEPSPPRTQGSECTDCPSDRTGMVSRILGAFGRLISCAHIVGSDTDSPSFSSSQTKMGTTREESF